MMVNIFKDCVFYLKVNSLSAIQKKELKIAITSNGGVISFVLNKKCTHVVVNTIGTLCSFNWTKIQKYQIQVVESDYIWKCLQKQCLVHNYQYPNEGTKPDAKWLQSLHGDEALQLENDNEMLLGSDFHEDEADTLKDSPDSKLAKYCFLRNNQSFAVLELLLIQDSNSLPYKISAVAFQSEGCKADRTFQFTDTIQSACEKYERSINNYKKEGFKMVNRIPPNAAQLTSKAQQKLMLQEAIIAPRLSPDVCYFVESVWIETVGYLNNVLSLPVTGISLCDVSKAECVLFQVRRAMDMETEQNEMNRTMSEFYQLIPHKEPIDTNIDKKLLARKHHLCQLIRDFINISERNSGNLDPSFPAKYRALQCQIEHVDPQCDEFIQLAKQVLDTRNSDELIRILNIFRVGKLSEDLNFISEIGNIRSLFHVSSTCDIIGSLYRGLLLPECVDDNLGLKITNSANHENGISFNDSMSSIINYTKPSDSNGTRLMLVCDVALGSCMDIYKRDSITTAPGGFHSVHGVRQVPGKKSDFMDDEFVVYEKDQVKMKYVVQFCTNTDEVNLDPDVFFIRFKHLEEDDEEEDESDEVQLDEDESDKEDSFENISHDDESELHDESDDEESRENKSHGEESNKDKLHQEQSLGHEEEPNEEKSDASSENSSVAEKKANGLQSVNGHEFPLENVYVKGRIIDFTAEVTLFQNYIIQSVVPIESKYVFPLDNTATVCGFEVFINGKHLIGKVKEKTPVKEYRDANREGKETDIIYQDDDVKETMPYQEHSIAMGERQGADLLDGDDDAVFMVNIGTVPPKATITIKVTYITEMNNKEGNFPLYFCIPCSVGSQPNDENEEDTYHDKKIYLPNGCFSLDMSIEVPCKIKSIESRTHLIKLKKTDYKAVITTDKDSFLDDEGFCLEIALEDDHFPRLWVEKHPDQDSKACMVVYLPKCEVLEEKERIATICIDCSNSMEYCFEDARTLALEAAEQLNSYFSLNVVVFGTSYKEFHTFPKPHTWNWLKKIQKFIKLAKPNMGSSDFWKPLQSLSLLSPPTSLHKILVISDGHIQNESLVYHILKKSAGKIRLFTCGVGSTANKHALKCLAQESGGGFEFFGGKNESDWGTQMYRQSHRMWSTVCRNVSVQWMQKENGPEPIQAPVHIPNVYKEDRLLVYSFNSHCSQVVFKAFMENEVFEFVAPAKEIHRTTGKTLHKLAARAHIIDSNNGILHPKENINEMKRGLLKSFIVDLSKKYSIVSPFTSFGVAEKPDSSEHQEDHVPNLLDILSVEDVDILPLMNWDARKLKTPERKTIRYQKRINKWKNWRAYREPSESNTVAEDIVEYPAEEIPSKCCPAISSLISLQSEEGFWMLNEAVGSLININVNYLSNEVLVKNGINSFGRKGKDEVPKLISTLLVLQTLRTYNLQNITFNTLMKLEESSSSSFFRQAIEKAIKWARKTDNQYPGIYSRFGLGKDWDSVVQKLLSIYRTHYSSSSTADQ